MTKSVLVVSYLFPPLDCGVGRQVKFVKYLPCHGWTPVVLSVKKSRLRPMYNHEKMKDIPRDTEVHRTFSLESVPLQTWIPTLLDRYLGINRKWFRLVDQYVGWIPFALRSGIKILRDKKIDVIYSTSRPNSSHLIALLLKRMFEIPWIADFRDAWTLNPYIQYPKLILKIEERLERAVLEKADKVMTITDSIKDGFLEKYPDISKDKYVVLPHGADPDDFEDEPLMFIGYRGTGMSDFLYTSSTPFTLVYVGSIYGKRVDTARVFLDAVKELLYEYPEMKKDFRVKFVGNTKAIQGDVSSRKLEDVVSLIPHVPHKEALNYMSTSHALLLITGSSPTSYNDKKTSHKDDKRYDEMSGKLVEYLQTGKFILSLSSVDCTASKIVTSTRTGVVVDPGKRYLIKHGLQTMYELHKKGLLSVVPVLKEVQKYDVRRITEKLSRVLQDLIA